jgi:hypothetical protein
MASLDFWRSSTAVGGWGGGRELGTSHPFTSLATYMLLFRSEGKMKQHELKTWPIFFQKVLSKEKTFELRKNDRNFKTGDILILKEWEPNTKEYTGREAYFDVPYIMSGFGLKKDWIVMSIKPRGLLF